MIDAKNESGYRLTGIADADETGGVARRAFSLIWPLAMRQVAGVLGAAC